MNSSYDPNTGSAIGGIFQGLFGNSGSPFQKAGNAFKPYYNEAKGYQNPFMEFGKGGMQGFSDWLQSMSNPSGFINNLTNQYQQSPYNQFLQNQSQRAGTNAAAAGGLTGSTPFAQQLQQNSANIGQQGMDQWLQNVLGINSQYGQGRFGQAGFGQHAADILSQLAMNAGNVAGGAAYGKEAGKNQDWSSLIGGIGKLFGL